MAAKQDSSDDHLVVDVSLTREVAYTPWWDGLARRWEGFVRALPAHRDTKKGEKNARQAKIAIFAAGVGLAALLDGEWILLGVLLASLSLFIPMSQDRRRTLIARSKSSRRNQKRLETQSGQLVWDGRRVILEVDGKRVRRVLTNKGSHIVESRNLKGHLAIGIKPASAKKSESIWIETSAGPRGASIERNEIDLLVRAELDDLQPILARIEA